MKLRTCIGELVYKRWERIINRWRKLGVNFSRRIECVSKVHYNKWFSGIIIIITRGTVLRLSASKLTSAMSLYRRPLILLFPFVGGIIANKREDEGVCRDSRKVVEEGREVQMLPNAVLWLTADTLMNIQSSNKKTGAIIVFAVRLMPIWIVCFALIPLVREIPSKCFFSDFFRR